MLGNRLVHRVWGQIQLAGPGQYAILQARLPKLGGLAQARKHAPEGRRQKDHLALQAVMKPHPQRSVVLNFDFGDIPGPGQGGHLCKL